MLTALITLFVALVVGFVLFAVAMAVFGLLFSAIFGMSLRMAASFSRIFENFAFLRRWLPSLRPHSCRARRISFMMISMSAMASLASLVKGTFTLAMCTSMTAGPTGMPLPPRWSSS